MQVDTFKRKLFTWLRTQPSVFVLDSCNQPNGYELGNYEWIIGVGVLEQKELCHSDQIHALHASQFSVPGKWNFFVAAYDLKNAFHPLRSENVDVLDWPLYTVVVPEHVITLTRNGQLEIFSEQKEELLKLINQTADANDMPCEVSFNTAVSSLTQTEHHNKVEYIKQQIAEGNLYEMNLCMETVLMDFTCSNGLDLYRRLVELSPTPFSSFVRLNEKHLVCASPERFMSSDGERIYSQPIKGTSKRYRDSEEDRMSRMHLANSLKERAEHIMIVDLVRNDLSKVSEPGTVRVDELFGIYGYRQVNQMISTISGQLGPGLGFFEALKATYPMGSMTGAPKHITMEFIDDIETASRGWYSGSVGYIKPNGEFDSNVVIRSLMYDDVKKVAKYAVGGAITFDSDPNAEYDECLLKSKAIRELLN